jgi:hypothetical protein
MRGLETIIRMNMTKDENEAYDRELEVRRLEAAAFKRAAKRMDAVVVIFLLAAVVGAFIV